MQHKLATMKNLLRNTSITLLLVTLLISPSVFASHVAGGYISYECTGNPNEYTIRLTLYRDCSGIDLENTFRLNFSNSCGATNPSNAQCGISLPPFISPTPCFEIPLTSSEEVSQLCNEAIPNSTCNGGSLPGYEEYIYETTVVLPPCDSWTVTYSLCCRNPATNVSNATSDDFVIQTVINTSENDCNTTPQITAAPQPYVCVGQDVIYNLGAFEPDGDNIVYSLVSALSSPTNTVNYNGGYTPQEPIPGLIINENNGVVQYTPTQVGNYIIVIRMEEFDDDGNLLSVTDYDFQATVIECDNDPPVAGSGGISNIDGEIVQEGEDAITMCQNEDICFDLTFEDDDEDDVLSVVSNISNIFPGATVEYEGTNPVIATICLNSGMDIGTKNITFLVQDDACPIYGLNNYTFSIIVDECLECNLGVNAQIVECITTTDPLEYLIEGTINTNNPPTTGQIVVENCFGEQFTFDAPFDGPLEFSFNAPHTDEDCEITASYVNVDPDEECEASNSTTIFLAQGSIISATGDAVLCEGDTAVVTAEGVDNYSWNDTTIVSGESFIPPFGENEYIVTATDENGCTTEATVIVIMNENPIVNAGDDLDLCEGEAFTPNGSGAAVYQWSNDLENNQDTLLTEGSYTFYVVGVDENGCVGFDSINVTVFDSPDVSFTAEPTSGLVPLEVTFTNTSSSNSGFFWDFGNGTAFDSDEETLTEIYTEPGAYVVVLYSANENCEDTATTIIQVIYEPPSFDIPNVFTPNGDGTNDTFKLIDLFGEEFIDQFEIVIVNRWGNHMRTFYDPAFEWDGRTESGEQATEGTYFYKVVYNVIDSAEDIEHHGFVQLVRD